MVLSLTFIVGEVFAALYAELQAAAVRRRPAVASTLRCVDLSQELSVGHDGAEW